MSGFVSYSADNDRSFQRALDSAYKAVGDLTIPLQLISDDFYKSERAIFQLKGPGQYPDLAESTKKDKARRGYPVYPILKRTGALESSVTNPNDPNAINEITSSSLRIGTKLVSQKGFPYPTVHQEGSRTVPMRKFLFIGPESTFATSEQAGRLQRWTSILQAYVMQHAPYNRREAA